MFMIEIRGSKTVFCRQSFVGQESTADHRTTVPCHHCTAAMWWAVFQVLCQRF